MRPIFILTVLVVVILSTFTVLYFSGIFGTKKQSELSVNATHADSCNVSLFKKDTSSYGIGIIDRESPSNSWQEVPDDSVCCDLQIKNVDVPTKQYHPENYNTLSARIPQHTMVRRTSNDIIYYSTTEDTLYGTIQFEAVNGVVRGPGIIVITKVWKNYKSLIQPQSHFYIVGKDTMISDESAEPGVMQMYYQFSYGYIKTETGYFLIENKFTFTPN